MSRRTSLAAIVKTAIEDKGASLESVAQAADITVPELQDRLSGDVPFGVSELDGVGGFLHVEAALFLEGAA